MNFAIIVAAGRGSRAGGVRAKQFREISGIPVIIHTLSRFETKGSSPFHVAARAAPAVSKTVSAAARLNATLRA